MSEKIKKSKYCKTTNIRYGSGNRQLFDIYEDGLISLDYTFIYIHGGYWQDLHKDISAYCVEPLVNAGIRVIIPGYDLAPTSKFTHLSFKYICDINKHFMKIKIYSLNCIKFAFNLNKN